MLYLGADHRGFKLKEELKEYLISKDLAVEDVGAFTYDPDDDYVDFAVAAATKVAENPTVNRGILLCGSGMGMDVAANKIKGIRATVAYSRQSAAHARTNDDINVISFAGDTMDIEEAKEITDVFINTPFSGEDRYIRRLYKIKEVENKNFK